MKKRVKISLIACVAYFILWVLQLIVYSIVSPESIDIATTLPAFLKVQINLLGALLLIIVSFSGIYWRKDIWKEITTFINE